MKKLLSIFLAIALMATMSVTAFAEEPETATITVEMQDSNGDGWDDRARILVLAVPDFENMEGEDDVLGSFTLESGRSGTGTLEIGKDQTVYFFWLFDNDGQYNYEASFTIKRDGVTVYSHEAEEEACSLTNWERLLVSEPIDASFTTVTYNVAPTYTVTIPATVALGQNATIAAENVVVEKGKQVEVALTDANGFTVATPQGAELGYTVKNGETPVNEGDTVLTVNPDGGKTGETTLTFTTPETAKYAGDYTGTVTFTVAVKDAPVKIINFTMDTSWIGQYVSGLTTNLQAEEGMTWEEWLESDYNVDGYDFGNYIYPAGGDWVAVRDTQTAEKVAPTDEIVADRTYDFVRMLG